VAKRVVWTDQAKADIRGIEQPAAIQILKTLGRYLSREKAAPSSLTRKSHKLIAKGRPSWHN